MKFCPECESAMTKNTSAVGTIVFQCKCNLTLEGSADDTLMAEGFLESAKDDLKHSVFIDNAPFDAAAYVVLRDCPVCGLNFMTMIRVGSNETTMYRCYCGNRVTHDEYMKKLEPAETAPADTAPAKPRTKKL